ncbi:hypothetical protein WDW89_20675 [Deltaproteobacteria bacterium TL4]
MQLNSFRLNPEHLWRTHCFCGSELTSKSPDAQKRRQLIENSIEQSRSADALQEAATSLFYSVRSESFGDDVTKIWTNKYADLIGEYDNVRSDISKFERELERLQNDIDKIGDTQLSEKRNFEKSLRVKINDAKINLGSLTTQIEEAKERINDFKEDRIKLEKKLSKTDSSADKLKLARTVKDIFEKVFNRLRKDEVKTVSIEMNRIFLKMIGADPEQNDFTMITKAELTENFDILVFGPKGYKLDPDQDLNGASRRAITLSFILALTKVSQVNAPNVIDTPLGMTSGYVKQSILKRTLEEGSQIILFLTHDEIHGIENILDAKAGIIYTLTNPAHYPRMLVNKTDVDDARIVRCECNHRHACKVCERKNEELEV